MKLEPQALAEKVFAETDVAFLATCEGDQPRVRPVNIAMREGMTLWVASYSYWGKVGQLQKNPKVEVNVLVDSGAHVRIEGRGFIRDSPEQKRRVFDAFPLMRRYFEDPADPQYALIEIVPDKVGVKDAWDLEYRPVPLPPRD